MKKIIIFSIFIFSQFIFGQNLPFNQANTSQIWEIWTNYDTGIQVEDVLNLRGGWNGFSNFCDQVFSNVSVVPGPSGKWYIYGYGDHKLLETSVGDASWLIARNADGKYDLVPKCHYNPQIKCFPPVYERMEPVLKVKEVQKPGGGYYDWPNVGGMGQRMAVFYSPQADAGGNHYFAIIEVDDFGDPRSQPQEDPKLDDRFYLVWAVSNNGIDWNFEKKYPNFSNCNDTNLYLTQDSSDAREFIYRYCFQRDDYLNIEPKLGTFHHYALYYSDPTKTDIYGNHGDGYLYLILGYTPGGVGITNIALRIKMNFSSCTGRDLNQPIQIYRDENSFYCLSGSSWQNLSFCDCPSGYIEDSDFPGCIPLNFSQDFRSSLFNKFIPGIAVPFDWITLKDRWGNFYGSVIVYDSEHTFGTDRVAIRFTRDIKPPFRWTEERELDTCSISPIYSTCEAGGNNVGLYQPPYSPQWYDYYDSQTGAPKKLIAYFGFTKHDCVVGNDCTVESAGILPATIDLTNYTNFAEIQELKIWKGGEGKLILTWIPQGGVEGYEILEGTLRNNKCGEYRTGGLPFNPSGYNNDPYCQNICLEDVRYDHFRKCYWKDINNNCCSWLDQNGKCCDNEIC